MDEWELCGQKGKIQKNVFTAKAERVAAYGKMRVSDGICEWKVRYNHTGKQCCREIGIATSADILNGYLSSKCIVWLNTDIYSSNKKICSVDKKIETNDIVTIKLDFNQNKVSFWNNNAQNKMVNIDIEPNKAYRLCAHLDVKGQSFTILSCNHSNGFPNLVTVKSTILQQLQLLNEYYCDKLKQLQLDELLNLQKTIESSENEFKEIEQSLDELKQKLNFVKSEVIKAITPDANNYKAWTPKDIVRYICLLDNGKYATHSDALLNSLTEQGISGGDLLDIEKNDLFTIGIKNFKDRTAIFRHIQALAKYDNAEGNDTENID